MNKKVRVSVIMSAYNTERYIEEAVKSILNQTFRDFEFLIFDDGSTDQTFTLLKKLARKDKRIQLFSDGKNKGYIPRFNELLKKAKGEYLARMDADDVSLPKRFEKEVSFLDANPGIALVGTQGFIINRMGVKIGKIEYPTSDGDIRNKMVARNPFIHPSTMYRKSALRGLGGYDQSFHPAEDYEFFSRMLQKRKAANLSEFLINYRWDFNQNIGFTCGKKQERSALRARWRMITKYGWPLWHVVFIIKPAISFCVPMKVKKWLLNRLHDVNVKKEMGE